jgi:nucleotide-binding universal stress UspA family protein
MKRFKNILVVVTPDGDSEALLSRAADLARRNEARLTLFGVVDSERAERRVVMHDGEVFDVRSFLVDARREDLEGAASALSSSAGVPIDAYVASGVDFVEVIKKVLRDDHDLVMVGSVPMARIRGVAGSSLAMHLLRKCPVPVWVDSGMNGGSPDVAVAIGPFDDEVYGESLNLMLLQLGTSLAARRHGTLHVIHAWRLEGESLLRRGRVRPPAEQIDAMVEEEHQIATMGLKRLMERVPDPEVPIEVHLEKGEPGIVIPTVLDAHQPGVVVMGTLARAGLRGVFMGNTAERVLGAIDASVLAVKPRGFETPVAV